MDSVRAEVLAQVEAAALAGDDARLDLLFEVYPWLDDVAADLMAEAADLDVMQVHRCDDPCPACRMLTRISGMDQWHRVLALLTARADAAELHRAALELARWQLRLQRLRELPAAAAAPVDSRPVTDRESRKTPGGRGRNLPAHRSTGPPPARSISWQVTMPP